MAHALEIILTEAERVELERRARRRKIARGDAMRAEILLLAATGYTNKCHRKIRWSNAQDGTALVSEVCAGSS
jgi:hypothetical protein